MEDSHFEILHFGDDSRGSLFGVFDGHGGSAVARFCGDHFPSVLEKDVAFRAGETLKAFKNTYLKLDDMLQDPTNFHKLKKYMKGTANSSTTSSPSPTSAGQSPRQTPPRISTVHPAYNVGCTAIVVYVHDNTLYVANTGDSRAVLCRDGEAIDLTTDHKVTLDSELERITNAGGVVVNGRVNGSLNLTRAIGDFSFKSDPTLSPENQMITANPDIREFELIPETDDFIVIACDGLWEVMTSQEVVDYVSHGIRRIRGVCDSSPSEDLPTTISDLTGKMLDLACSEDVGKTEGLGGDNMSCIIVDLRPGKPLSNLERVSKCSEGPFVLKPSRYKAFEFIHGAKAGSSSHSSDEFTESNFYENRLERLDEDEMVTCNSGLSPRAGRDSEIVDDDNFVSPRKDVI